jgi:xanthosine utilization system XapX-like protein
MNPDLELQKWQSEWQTEVASAERLETIARYAAACAQRHRHQAIKSWVAGAFVTAVMAGVLVRSQGAPYVVAIAAVLLLYVGAEVAHAAVLLRTRSMGNLAFAEFALITRKGFEQERAFLTFRSRSAVVLALIIMPWLVWVAFVRHEVIEREPWRGTLSLAIVVLALAWGAIRTRTRRQVLTREEQAVHALSIAAEEG